MTGSVRLEKAVRLLSLENSLQVQTLDDPSIDLSMLQFAGHKGLNVNAK